MSWNSYLTLEIKRSPDLDWSKGKSQHLNCGKSLQLIEKWEKQSYLQSNKEESQAHTSAQQWTPEEWIFRAVNWKLVFRLKHIRKFSDLQGLRKHTFCVIPFLQQSYWEWEIFLFNWDICQKFRPQESNRNFIKLIKTDTILDFS